MQILFYVAYPYYYPHFLPIGNYFSKMGHDVKYILSKKQNSKNMQTIAEKNSLNYSFDLENLLKKDIDVVFFANNSELFSKITALKVLLEHGIGTKFLESFYSAIKNIDIYLIEGNYQYKKMLERYPQYQSKLTPVGFSKFDEIINFQESEKEILFQKYNLDKNKKTILYAPTFFPSSIEKMKDDFPAEFLDCNILIKPHYLTYERKKYKNQLKKFSKWQKYENCILLPLDEYNLVPFLAISDIMISDESSAMFEFAALNKPVISNQYFKLRWSYYLMPWKLSKRIDKSKDFYRNILDNAYNYTETIFYTKEALTNPKKLESKRLKFSQDLCGEIDGKVSERIYNAITKKLSSEGLSNEL